MRLEVGRLMLRLRTVKIKRMKRDASPSSFGDAEVLAIPKLAEGADEEGVHRQRHIHLSLPPPQHHLLQTRWTVSRLVCLRSSSSHTAYGWRDKEVEGEADEKHTVCHIAYGAGDGFACYDRNEDMIVQ
jgi:hypothetical protein